MAERLALIVFPHAGASAASYRALNRRLREHVDVHAVELPGHGRIGQQPCLGDMRAIAAFAAAEARPILARGPAALFGHSMGAWVAYLVADCLREHAPRHLFVSAARPPHLGVHRKLLALDPDAFVRELELLGGVPPELLTDRDALELFLPALRADLGAIERFQPPLGRPIDVPITALRATGDEITFEDAEAWAETTTAPCRVHTLPGGHFYLLEQPDLVSAVLMRALAAGGRVEQPA